MVSLDGMAASNARILVLDDDPGWNQTMQLVLGSYGLHVETSESLQGGPEASSIDAILLDLSMSGGSPEDLIRDVCKRFPGVPVVILTGREDPGDDSVISVIESGAHDWLSKDSKAAAIVRAVRLAIARTKIAQLRSMGS